MNQLNDIDTNYLLIFLGIAAIIIEVLLGAITGFDLLLLGVIFVIAGIVGLFSSVTIALITIIVLSLAYVAFGRKLLKDRMTIATKTTSSNALLGKKATVIKKITPHHAGQVKMEGEIWRAQSDTTLDADEVVTIQSVSGVTLTVTK